MADSPGTLCLLREERLLEQKGERMDDMRWEGGGLEKGHKTGTETQQLVPVVLAMVPSLHLFSVISRGEHSRAAHCPLSEPSWGTPKHSRGMSGYISVGLKHRVPLGPLLCPEHPALCLFSGRKHQ